MLDHTGAAHSAAKNKTRDEDAPTTPLNIRAAREAPRASRGDQTVSDSRLPEDLRRPNTCEIMKDPELCVEDGHTYEQCVGEWFATGARTSPSTSRTRVDGQGRIIWAGLIAAAEQHRAAAKQHSRFATPIFKTSPPNRSYAFISACLCSSTSRARGRVAQVHTPPLRRARLVVDLVVVVVGIATGAPAGRPSVPRP